MLCWPWWEWPYKRGTTEFHYLFNRCKLNMCEVKMEDLNYWLERILLSTEETRVTEINNRNNRGVH